jgi:hypothetical protein
MRPRQRLQLHHRLERLHKWRTICVGLGGPTDLIGASLRCQCLCRLGNSSRQHSGITEALNLILEFSLPRSFQEFLAFNVPVFVVPFQIILYALFVDKSCPVQSTFLQNIQLRGFIVLCHLLQIRLSFNWSSCQGLF